MSGVRWFALATAIVWSFWALCVGLVASGQSHTDLVMHCKVDWCGPTDIAKVDEPPTEWATYEWEPHRYEYVGSIASGVYYPPQLTEEQHFGCVDPKRVLLTSEDGVKHCYDFGQLAGNRTGN